MKKILLVDDHEMVRDAIILYFKKVDNCQIASEASNGIEALELMKQNTYDLILSDIVMPKMDGIEFVKQLRIPYPDQPVLILTMYNDISNVKKLIEIGVNGFILKNGSRESILEAVQKVLSGGDYYSKEIYQALINSFSKRKPKERTTFEVSLSEREKEILRLITEEHSNQEIADKLFISIRTVETHKGNLLSKTGCKNVAGLVMYAVEKELV